MKQLTRRNLFASVAAAAPLLAIAQEAPTTTPKTSIDEDLRTAREVMANNAALLAIVQVPIATEPAFVFKA
jgi:hypothetical protein